MKTTFKKSLSIILSICMIFSVLAIGVGAKEDNQLKTNYPFIFIHGMLGWGENSYRNEETPYWGFSQENNVMTYLRNQGYEVYNPSVGCISSAWDRACELYAQLMGTVVDYGEAHSKKYGHERYGRDYTGQATMGEPWNFSTPLNLVGHSFGGATVRLFATFIAYGYEEEIKATGENTSPLFMGGHEELIHSVSTLAAPHEGSVVSNYMAICPIVPLAIALLINKSSVSDEPNFDINANQWGITDKISLIGCMKFAFSNDNVCYDLTIEGARELNKKIKTVKTAYYFSYASTVTEKGLLGLYTSREKETVYGLLNYTSPLIALTVNTFADGQYLDNSWGNNDGIVPVNSARYPKNEQHLDYEEGITIIPGIWYSMPLLKNVDHIDYCSGAETGEFGSKESYFGFYLGIVQRVCEV